MESIRLQVINVCALVKRLQSAKYHLVFFILFNILFGACTSTKNSNSDLTADSGGGTNQNLELYPFRKNTGWGFADPNKKLVIEAKYSLALPFSEGLAFVCSGNRDNFLCGYIDKSGKEVIKFSKEIGSQSNAGPSFHDGLAKVGNGFIDKSGTRVIDIKDGKVGRFSDDWALVSYASGNQKQYFIDRTGKTVFTPNPNYSVSSFSDGLAVFSPANSEKKGYIDKTGKIVIPPKYDIAEDFHEGLAWVSIGGGFSGSGFIDKTGKMVIRTTPLITQFSEGLAFIISMGYVDRTGDVKIKTLYTLGEPFSEGMAAVELDDKWGYIDKSGKEVIPRRPTNRNNNSPGGFNNGVALTWCGDGKECYIDKKGTEYYEP